MKNTKAAATKNPMAIFVVHRICETSEGGLICEMGTLIIAPQFAQMILPESAIGPAHRQNRAATRKVTDWQARACASLGE